MQKRKLSAHVIAHNPAIRHNVFRLRECGASSVSPSGGVGGVSAGYGLD